MSYNEDVEVGRCISRILGVQCTWSYQVREIPHWIEYYQAFSMGVSFYRLQKSSIRIIVKEKYFYLQRCTIIRIFSMQSPFILLNNLIRWRVFINSTWK